MLQTSLGSQSKDVGASRGVDGASSYSDRASSARVGQVVEGVLIDPSIRDKMLWAFPIQCRKEFVAKLSHRF